MSRRRLVWARQVTSFTNETLTRFNPLFTFESSYAASLIGITVVRVRGVFQAYDPTNAAPGIAVVAMRKTTRDELSDDSGPLTEPHADWFMWSPMPWGQSLGAIYQPTEFDVKSMRRMDEVDETLICAVESSAGITGNLVTSTLIMLP